MEDKLKSYYLEREDFWDYLCSQLGILEDDEKIDIIREFIRRFYIENLPIENEN